MAAAADPAPDRVAVETLSGSIEVGPVVEKDTRAIDHRPRIQYRVELDEDVCQWFDEDEVEPVANDLELLHDDRGP